MSEFVMFGNSSCEKTRLAHVETQTLQASISIERGKSFRINEWFIMQNRRTWVDIPQSDDRCSFAYVAFRLVTSWFGCSQPVEHREPDNALGLTFHPGQEVDSLLSTTKKCLPIHLSVKSLIKFDLNWLPLFAGLVETRLDWWFDVWTTEGGHFAKFARHLDAIVEEDSQFWCVNQSIRIGN